MPGRFFLETPPGEIARWAGAEAGGIDVAPRRNIAPGEEIVVCPPERVLRLMRWGILPVGRVNARGRPVMETLINARSETLFEKSAFEGVGRAIVPADGWYEWTGAARRKQVWRLRPKEGGPMGFAAITDTWEAPGGRRVEQVAMVTCEPSAEVAAIHHRMGVILRPAEFDAWMAGDIEEARALMRPLAEGSLSIGRIDEAELREA